MMVRLRDFETEGWLSLWKGEIEWLSETSAALICLLCQGF